MWQKIIGVVIVIACLLFVGRRLLRQLKGKPQASGCGGSCPGCSLPDKPSGCPGEPPAKE